MRDIYLFFIGFFKTMSLKSILFLCSFLGLFSGMADSSSKDRPPFPLNKTLIRQFKQQGQTLLSDRVGDYILRAESLTDSKKYDQAIELLEYHYNREGLTKLEKAHFVLHIGRIYGQKKDKKQALSYFQTALDLKALPYHHHLSALYWTAQIYAGDENYNKALKLLKFWFSINEKPPPSSYILLAHCYYAKGQLNKALSYVEQGLSIVGRPMENWLEFASAIHLKQKNYKKALPHLEKLTALYPSTPRHWRQLAGVYLHLNKNRHAFVTLSMAHRMGHLKSKSDYLNLSSLYVWQGLPYQGGQLLQAKISQKIIAPEQKHLELLAEAYWLARERKESLSYLKEAGKKAVQPRFFIQYGQKLLDEELWGEAERAFKKALNTKKMKKTIQNIQEHKKQQALVYKRENDLRQRVFFQSRLSKAERPSFMNKDVESEEKDSGGGGSDGKSANNSQQKPASLKAPSTNHLESVYLGIGIALYQQKKYEEALSYFRRSIEVDDTFLSGYQWIDYAEAGILEKRKKESQELLIYNKQ